MLKYHFSLIKNAHFIVFCLYHGGWLSTHRQNRGNYSRIKTIYSDGFFQREIDQTIT